MFRSNYDEEQRLWRGADIPSVFDPRASLGQLVLYALKTHGSRIAQINDDSGITMRFDEMRSKSIRAAKNLRSLGYKKNQVFGFIASNAPDVAPLVFASLYLGCPMNTIDPSFGKNEIKHMLNVTKPSLMFCDAQVYDLVKSCLDDLGNAATIFTFSGQAGDSQPVENLFVANGDENDFIPVDVDGEKHTAFICCSSGTTGLSKGVCLSHTSICNGTMRFLVPSSDDVILVFSTLYWITGVLFLIAGTLSGAKRLITTQPITIADTFRMIEQYKVTYIWNSLYRTTLLTKSELLKTSDLSSVKYYFTGGSRVPRHIPIELSKHLPNGGVHVGYGLTEIGSFASADFPVAHGQDTVGRLIGGLSAKIVDDDGNRCGVGEEGELCLKGTHPFLGYHNNQEANDEAFDREGFLMTGDIARFDQNGYLYIVDRKKEMIKYRTIQMSPSFIEAHLMKSPLIESVCVVGIPHDADGDLAAACIIRARDAEIDEEAVHKMMDDNFMNHCQLRGGVYFVDSLPTTASGKLLRRIVKQNLVDLYNKKKLE